MLISLDTYAARPLESYFMAYNILGIDLICPSLQLQVNINQAAGVFQMLLNSVLFAKDPRVYISPTTVKKEL